ncbi:Condensin complex subunit 1 [Toxocara canis]|uniref:Condensin complex subunit 1 n=1 Tax=Toxocara canis TaxID=6265 RepID=A0A0B2V3V3_TOXCA|nr:Condensin complex subunit 1 [Toxocara canis]
MMWEEYERGGEEVKNFIIPLRDNDLLEENDDFYTVDVRPSLEEVISEVFAFKREVEDGQWQRIVTHFGYFFFTLKRISEGEPWRLRVQLISALITGLNGAVDSIEELLPVLMGDAEEATSTENVRERQTHARAFQMYVYLLCRLSDLFETEAVNKQKSAAYSGVKRCRKALLENEDAEFVDRWIVDRQEILTVMQRALSLSVTDAEGKKRHAAIKYLWEPAIICPNFMRVVKDLAYKLLENPELGKLNGREWLRMIFNYLRIICINFDEFPKVGSKLIGLMKRLDYLSVQSQTQSPFVDAIEAASVKDDMDPLFKSMLDSFARLTASDFSKSDVSARPFALFIMSLAEKKPRLLNRHIVNIVFCLSNDKKEFYVSKQLNDDEKMVEEEDRVEDFTKQLKAIDSKISYCQEALMFSLEMEKCLSSALRSVMTGQANELAESIHLIVEARKFAIRGSEKAVRELFRVVWRRDNAIRETVVKSGKDLFISANQDPNVATRKTAENLIRIVLGVCEEDRISLEQVICLMARENMLTIELLDAFSSVVFSTQGALRIAALRLFSIICRANKEFMRERFEFFVEMSRREAFFDGDDGTLAAEYFNAVSMLGGLPNAKDLSTLSEIPFRLPQTHRIIRCIETLLIENVSNKNYEWLCVMEKAINAIYYAAARPSRSVRRIASSIISQAKNALASFWLSKQHIDAVACATFKDTDDETELDPKVEELLTAEERWQEERNDVERISEMEVDDNREETKQLDEEDLTQMQHVLVKALEADAEQRFELWELIAERVCAFTGQVALKTLIHVDISFLAEMKRKNELVHAMRQAASLNGDVAKRGKPRDAEEYPEDREPTKLEIESIERTGFFEASEEDVEDPLGLTGFSDDERIAQRANRICEVGVFRRRKLLSRLTPFLLFIVRSKKTICTERLRSAAALALSKVMLLSMRVCMRMMPIFVHFLTHSPSAECRSNLMIAAGDLCFRFPNVVEKYSYHLYERIRDKDAYVRETCVIVLAHLILNDMVRIRGTVGDIARCIVDANVNIANLAKFFFAELSKKGNIIYNLMPDVVSRLSSNQEVAIDDFREIMKLLLSFIKKDKQADSLLEKLCQRMYCTEDSTGKVDERLAECLSYCISRLPLSEKSLRTMTELLPSYAYLLYLDTVFTNLSTAITHFRKANAFRNTQLKAELDDFLEKLTRIHIEKVEEESVVNHGLLYRKKARKLQTKVKSSKN